MKFVRTPFLRNISERLLLRLIYLEILLNRATFELRFVAIEISEATVTFLRITPSKLNLTGN